MKRTRAKKTRLDLIPLAALHEIAAAFEDGAEQYAPWAWRNGRSWLYHMGALLRHVFAWACGQDVDPKSGVHHLAHAASRAMILLEFWHDPRYHKFDDRGKATRGPTREPE